jgi:hypothetical protein
MFLRVGLLCEGFTNKDWIPGRAFLQQLVGGYQFACQVCHRTLPQKLFDGTFETCPCALWCVRTGPCVDEMSKAFRKSESTASQVKVRNRWPITRAVLTHNALLGVGTCATHFRLAAELRVLFPNSSRLFCIRCIASHAKCFPEPFRRRHLNFTCHDFCTWCCIEPDDMLTECAHHS